MDKYELENQKYIDEQLQRLPHQHRDAALKKYEVAISEEYKKMTEAGMAAQMAETRSVAAANARLRHYVEARINTLAGAVQPPNPIG